MTDAQPRAGGEAMAPPRCVLIPAVVAVSLVGGDPRLVELALLDPPPAGGDGDGDEDCDGPLEAASAFVTAVEVRATGGRSFTVPLGRWVDLARRPGTGEPIRVAGVPIAPAEITEVRLVLDPARPTLVRLPGGGGTRGVPTARVATGAVRLDEALRRLARAARPHRGPPRHEDVAHPPLPRRALLS